jgi:hypothetical protein
MDRDHIEPVSGFAEGDLVVVAGQTGLKDRARVRLPGDPDPEAEKDHEDNTAPMADKAAEQTAGQNSSSQADSGEGRT